MSDKVQALSVCTHKAGVCLYLPAATKSCSALPRHSVPVNDTWVTQHTSNPCPALYPSLHSKFPPASSKWPNQQRALSILHTRLSVINLSVCYKITKHLVFNLLLILPNNISRLLGLNLFVTSPTSAISRSTSCHISFLLPNHFGKKFHLGILNNSRTEHPELTGDNSA